MSESGAPEDEPIVIVPWVPDKNELWKNVIRPVVISQVLAAQTSPIFNDKCLVIEGRGFGEVVLVAHVVGVEFTPASTVYQLEDGSGRIKASMDYVSLLHGLSPEAEECEKAQALALQNTYVQVTGAPSKGDNWARISLKSIQPVEDYNQVMYHILNVIYSNMLMEQHIEPYKPNGLGLNKEKKPEGSLINNQASASEGALFPQPQVFHSVPAVQTNPPVALVNPGRDEAPHSDVPSFFTPRKHRPYANLSPLARCIIKYMQHQAEKTRDKIQSVSISEMGLSVQASHGCTEMEFNLAIQKLLSEAYITSPLDDGYVVITPRH